jgi:hypothetical protein
VGNVDSVSLSNGVATLNIGSNTMSLTNIEGVYPPGSTASTGSTDTGSTDTGSTDTGTTGQ